MRAFVAIDLPEHTRHAIATLQAGLRPGRKAPEENLHLTLAFLDDQPETVLRALHGALGALDLASFELTLAGLDMFGGKRPRLLFLRAAPTSALQALHLSVRRAAAEVGIDLPRERFRPHVTLARFRRDMLEEQAMQVGRFLAQHGDVALPLVEVQRFCLFGSSLHPEGAVHEVLAEYRLRDASQLA